MSDIQTMQQMIAGLQQKKKNLQVDEAVFLKLSGINEQIEKASQDRDEYQKELAEAKARRDNAKKKKAAAVSEVTSKIEQKMEAVLPSGKAVFTYEEDDDGKRSMKIGWMDDEKMTPYNGMSGMQKQVFDTALAHLLDADIIVLEAAELDQENLEKTLLELSLLDKQVLVSTWFPVKSVPDNFAILEI